MQKDFSFKVDDCGVFVTSQSKHLFFCVARYENFAVNQKASISVLSKNFLLLVALRISSYGCSWEVWRALKKLELLVVLPYISVDVKCHPYRHRNKTTLRHPHEGQLTAVKMGHPLTISDSIAGFFFYPSRSPFLLKFSADSGASITIEIGN